MRPDPPERASAIVVFVLNLAGSVALLLWAVRMIRTGVERAFMPRLRAGLRTADQSALRAAAFGGNAAILLQSSTAVAMLAVSFVAAGTLGGKAALALLLGADIGSAIAVQIYSVPVEKLIPLLLLVGIGLFFNGRNRTVKQTGRIVTGLALVFVSLTMIRGATEPLRDSPPIDAIMGYLATDPISAFAIGAVLAWAMHSSIAAVLTFVAFAAHGVLPVEVAAALVLGANLGGAAIPLTLSLSAPVGARRVLLANLGFRGGGAVLALGALSVLTPDLSPLGATPARQIVNLHLAFNIAIAALALPLMRPALAAVAALLPDRMAGAHPARISALDETVIDDPDRAMGCATREVLRMGESVHAMLVPIMGLYRDWDAETAAFIDESEDEVDRTHFETKLYIARLQQRQLSPAQSRRAMDIATFANHMEDAADQISTQMKDIAKRVHAERLRFSEDGWRDLNDFHDCVLSNTQLALNVLLTGDVESARQLLEEKVRIRELEQKMQIRHLARLRESPASIETSNLHQETLRALKHVNSAVSFVAYPIVEDAGELLSSRLADPPRGKS
ncbi:MAG: Na/Pi cotransporter family protein [Rhodobacteraceae bacterium]|nr:Na/Pi cotransporter family protein [Paracoccaceae bacterium]